MPWEEEEEDEEEEVDLDLDCGGCGVRRLDRGIGEETVSPSSLSLSSSSVAP